APRRREIHLGARRERHQLEPLGCAPPQLTVRMGDERRPLSDLAQAVDGQQDLILAAPPGPGRVDMKRKHLSRFQVLGSRFSVLGSRTWNLELWNLEPVRVPRA